MTKKEIKCIAEALRRARDSAPVNLSPQAHAMWELICLDIADCIAANHSGFVREEFLSICDPTQHG